MSCIQSSTEESEPPNATSRALKVRPARWPDVFEISDLIRAGAPHCVPITPCEAFARIGEFDVVELAGEPLAATMALRDLHDGRVELRGLSVHSNFRGRGLGRVLVRRAICRARTRGADLVCVTTQPAFFERLGFHAIPLDSIPPKPGRVVVVGDGRVAFKYTNTQPKRWTNRATATAA